MCSLVLVIANIVSIRARIAEAQAQQHEYACDVRNYFEILREDLSPAKVAQVYPDQTEDLSRMLSDAERNSSSVERDLPQDVTLRLLTTASGIDQNMRDSGLVDHIYQSLNYHDLAIRQEMIPEAYKATFDWAFKKPEEHDSNHAWADFGQWLQESEPIYWITGKPGSGKSTLVKYLFHHPQTDVLIHTWVKSFGMGVNQVAKAGFFFWNSGTQIQMSKVGFGRSILLQLWAGLDAKSVAQFFPTRWKRCEILGEDKEPFTWEELESALNMVLSDTSRCFLFFIDGLDEFEGDKHELADYVVDLSKKTNVKICTASRPWIEFYSKFDGRPNLRMEDLTRQDITTYIEGRFASSREFMDLERHDLQLATNLKQSIAEKATGVFLWVYVVVSTLLEGLINGDRLERLSDKLETLPPELSDLFEKIIQQIEPKYAAEASELFQFVRAHAADATLIGLYWSQLSLDAVLHAEITKMSVEDAWYRAKLMQRNIVSRCKCLLAAGSTPDPRKPVTWIHRTVREFLEQPAVWTNIRKLSPEYDTDIALCLSRLRQAKASVTSHGYDIGDADRALQDAFLKTEVFYLRQNRNVFIQEVEKVGAVLAARRGPVVQDKRHVYWLDAESLYETGRSGVRLEGLTTAFHAALVLDWNWYFQDRMEEDPSVLEISATSEVRMDAITLASFNNWFDVQLMCLKAGAKPQRSTSRASVPLDEESFRPANAWQLALDSGRLPIDLCAEYLRCGADPYAENAQSTLSSLLRGASEEADPEDIRVIRKSIRKHHEWSDRRWRPYPRR